MKIYCQRNDLALTRQFGEVVYLSSCGNVLLQAATGVTTELSVNAVELCCVLHDFDVSCNG